MYNVFSMNKRVNVGLRFDVYTRLKDQGRFGESFSDLVSRIIDVANNNTLFEAGERLK
jgi:predicted CopG family antitoxin